MAPPARISHQGMPSAVGYAQALDIVPIKVLKIIYSL